MTTMKWGKSKRTFAFLSTVGGRPPYGGLERVHIGRLASSAARAFLQIHIPANASDFYNCKRQCYLTVQVLATNQKKFLLSGFLVLSITFKPKPRNDAIRVSESGCMDLRQIADFAIMVLLGVGKHRRWNTGLRGIGSLDSSAIRLLFFWMTPE